MKVLVTGSAGFIGFHLSKYLLTKNIQVIGIDNLNNYYNVKLKKDRNKILKKYKNYSFNKIDLINKKLLEKIIKKYKVKYIVHLAAQAGVRYSIINPVTYLKNNIEVFLNVLDLSIKHKIEHLVFASTSSVYGNVNKFPSKEKDEISTPVSFYAATKKANEVMAYSYSSTYKLPCTGLRFFTVYGPYGRPDMAIYKFTENIINNKPIDLYNHGNHQRDFTYIDDVISAINSLLFKEIKNKIPFKIFNIGKGYSNTLMEYLREIEKNLGKKAKLKNKSLQPGDIKKTHADISSLKKYINYKPKTDIKLGINKFVSWYLRYKNK